MKYTKINEKEHLPRLGFGCMRFPKKGGRIDMEKTSQLVMRAIELGVDYFDTAYIYGGSEAALGEILAANKCRENVMIASKLPHYLVKNRSDLDKYFDQQLKRLKTDYIDYYLMHMLPDVNVWNRLKSLGVEQWLEDKKSSGQIKKIGFSYHGGSRAFVELLRAYPWEFCQIQYNYMDEHSQAGRTGLMAAYEKNIPVIIMEPLRGGKLVNGLPPKAKKVLSGSDRSAAQWAMKWLWDQEEVATVLSGMNSMEMLEENAGLADETVCGEMTEKEHAVITALKEAIREKEKVPCTACSYCMPCPFGVDIPGVFNCYNVSYTESYANGFREYIMCTTFKDKKSNASLCRACGKCTSHCPQSIPIPQVMNDVKRRFENPIYKLVALVAKGRFRGK